MIPFLPPNSRLLAALSGLLAAAACPPLNLYPLGWVGLIPLLAALDNPRRNGFGEGFAAGLVFNSAVLYWLAFNTGTYIWVAVITMLAAALILACAWGVAAWVFRGLLERYGRPAFLLAPVSWAVWEGWLSHLGELAFPWPLLALTQAGFDPVLQMMEFVGVWGVGFWVVALNVAIYFVWRGDSRRSRRLGFAAVVVLAALSLTALRHAQRYYRAEYPLVRTVVVQGSMPAEEKWLRGVEASWEIYEALTRDAAGMTPNLIVWPETALPADLAHRSVYAGRLSALSDAVGAAIFTGASDYCRVDGERRPLNAAFLVRPDQGLVGRGAKRMLVPFGERVPFQWLAPQLGELNFGQAEFLPGSFPQLFNVDTPRGEARFPGLICYESAFPALTCDAVRRGANLLVTISNDAWYGRSSEPAQISALSRFRCIETRRSMARASNSGISFLADPLGRVVAQARLFEATWVAAELPLLEVQTSYVRFGDVLLALLTIIYGVVLLHAGMTPPPRRREGFRTAAKYPAINLNRGRL